MHKRTVFPLHSWGQNKNQNNKSKIELKESVNSETRAAFAMSSKTTSTNTVAKLVLDARAGTSKVIEAKSSSRKATTLATDETKPGSHSKSSKQ